MFAGNLRDLLLAAPAGAARRRWASIPGFRTGVKVAVVDATGKVVATDDHLSARAQAATGTGSLATLAALCRAHKVELVAIGNGTAIRETDKLVGRTDRARSRS